MVVQTITYVHCLGKGDGIDFIPFKKFTAGTNYTILLPLLSGNRKAGPPDPTSLQSQYISYTLIQRIFPLP